MDLDLLREAHGGFCVARHDDGKVVFVRGGLPGERVRVRLTGENARHSTADVVDVLQPSPDRVPHVWPAAADGAGGADLGHVSLPAQLRWKENVVADVLRRIGGPAVVAALPAPVAVTAVGDTTAGGRTRVSFAVDDAGRLAMRRPQSHDLVPVTDMPLAVPEVSGLGLFRGAWRWEGGTRVTAVVPSDSPPVVVTSGGVWEAPGVPGERRVREVVPSAGSDLRYVVGADGFWQVHRGAPEALVRRVLGGAALTGGERVLELYAGAGLFTLPLGRAVGRRGEVVSLEGSRDAVDSATINLAALPHVRVRRARVDPRWVGRVEGALDVVVLDPPRTGAGPALMRVLRDRRPGRIVYVACDPAALARDLREVIGEYRIEELAALDLFPHTHHVELVAVLVHAEGEASH